MANAIEFAGIKTKTTKHGGIRRPAYLKMLRSGLVAVRLRNRTTDDSAADNLNGHGRGEHKCPRELADEIASDSSGWEAEIIGNRLVVSRYTFISYDVTLSADASPVTTFTERSEAARAAMQRACPPESAETAANAMIAAAGASFEAMRQAQELELLSAFLGGSI